MLKKLFAIVLCFIVVITSQGFTINKSVCKSSGNQSISFSHIHDCCDDNHHENETSFECCDITKTELSLSVYNEVKSPVVLLTAVSNTFSVRPVIDIRNEGSINLFPNPPPLLTDNQYLNLISVLII